MKRILITGVGGPTPRSFVRAIKLFDPNKNAYEFIGVDANPLAYGLYEKELFTRSYVVPRASENNYWDIVNDIIEKEGIEGAIVLPEVEVIEWSKNHQKLTKKIKMHLPPYELATELINKHNLHNHLKDTVYIPKFSKVDPHSYSFFDVANLVGNTFWIRSTEGSSGLGSLKIESEEMLNQWVSINPLVDEFIATEFLPGRNLACKLLYFNGQLVRTACAERVNYIMAKVAPSGITGNTSFGRLINEPQLVEISKEVLVTISNKLNTELNGIFTVDFKEDAEGNPKITEINIRHVAFTSSIAAGGANLPADTLEAMFSDPFGKIKLVHYTFDKKMIFLRDVDGPPIILDEKDLFYEKF